MITCREVMGWNSSRCNAMGCYVVRCDVMRCHSVWVSGRMRRCSVVWFGDVYARQSLVVIML